MTCSICKLHLRRYKALLERTHVRREHEQCKITRALPCSVGVCNKLGLSPRFEFANLVAVDTPSIYLYGMIST